jgi:hypothetical protein
MDQIKKNELPVIIYGAGIVGEVLHQACINAGINVIGFCDNNLNKTKQFLRNLPVIHTPTLKKEFQDALFLISASDINDVIRQLDELGFTKWCTGSEFLRNFDIYQNQYSLPSDFVEYTVATAILCHDNFLTPDKLFLRSLDIMITERCSLKCQDCSNLMQYYSKPVDIDLNEIMAMVDRFCFLADEINEFRVLGGEPFMHKEAHLIIKRLIDEPKVKKVVIYTNGTILPKDEQLDSMINDKILFIITDYGVLSRNLDELTKKLASKKISYYVPKAKGWTDCSKIIKHNRSPIEQKELFGNCCAKNTITLSHEKLYRCPFAANAARLMATPDFTDDYVNIFDESLSVNQLKKKIRDYLLNTVFLKVCDYCNGRSFGDAEIQPAVQLKNPLAYLKY